MITVIITACGPSKTLRSTLECRPTRCPTLVADAEPCKENRNICAHHYVEYYQRVRDGFAANVNYLLYRVDTDYALLLGNDVMLLPNTFAALANHSNRNTIVQPILLDTTPVRRPPPKQGYTNLMCGNCTLIPMAFLRAHNLSFNESLFSYGEDTQFGFDWINAGGKILQLSDTYAVHDHRGYYNTTPSARKYYYLVRNSLYVAKHYPQWRIMGTAIALGCLFMKPTYFGDTISGLVDFFAGNTGPHPSHIYDSRP